MTLHAEQNCSHIPCEWKRRPVGVTDIVGLCSSHGIIAASTATGAYKDISRAFMLAT
jgi:hypothetical protein